ncbi:hypothetical protein Bca4012_010462 [Brassica carinata]
MNALDNVMGMREKNQIHKPVSLSLTDWPNTRSRDNSPTNFTFVSVRVFAKTQQSLSLYADSTDLTQITLRSELLSQIRGSVVILRGSNPKS